MLISTPIHLHLVSVQLVCGSPPLNMPMLGGPHFGPEWPTAIDTPLLPLGVVR